MNTLSGQPGSRERDGKCAPPGMYRVFVADESGLDCSFEDCDTAERVRAIFDRMSDSLVCAYDETGEPVSLSF